MNNSSQPLPSFFSRISIAIGAFFPVYMGVASGIRGADRKLIEVARLYQLSNIALTRRVLLPAALPAILTGLRNGLSLAWMFMVAAELIAASKGLGYLLSDGRETSRADIVLAAIALLSKKRWTEWAMYSAGALGVGVGVLAFCLAFAVADERGTRQYRQAGTLTPAARVRYRAVSRAVSLTCYPLYSIRCLTAAAAP